MAKDLRMSDIEAITHNKGQLVRWIHARNPDGHIMVRKIWAWEIEPGGQALIIEEQDGFVAQPALQSLH